MTDASNPRELLFYVQSKKTVTSFYRARGEQRETGSTAQHALPEGAASSSGTNISDDVGSAETAYILPDDQARALALLQEVAPPRGYSIKVVDVNRAAGVRKFFDTHLAGVEDYPVLVQSSTGKRLEGCAAFTEKSLLDLLPADLPHVRAFTQLKVTPSKVEEIRTQLLAFEPVKEVHLIAGDWDIYCVLEFPSGKSGGKKQVFDFVLQKLAKVPGVEDFSTMIPEYSVTKFPI